MDISGATVLITDTDGQIQYVNRRFTEVTGYEQVEIIGLTPRVLNSGKTPPVVYQELWKSLKRGDTWRGRILNRKQNGELFWATQSNTPIKDAKGQVIFYLSLSEDVSEIALPASQTRNRSYRDEVTEFGNRHLFIKDFDYAVKMYEKKKHELSIYLLRIDNFSKTSSERGVSCANCLISTIADRIYSIIQGEGSLYRIDIDHLVVIHAHQNTEINNSKVDQTLRYINKPIAFYHDIISVEITMGCTRVEPAVTEASELLTRADIALNYAKKQGLAWLEFGRDGNSFRNPSDSELFAELKRGMDNNQLHIEGQPIYDLDTGKVAIVEILLRWSHTIFGSVSPIKIIELAGNNGHLFNVAFYVVEKLLEFLALIGSSSSSVCFSVNLNVPQIINTTLINKILHLIDKNGIDRSRIVFESTENDSLPIPLSEANKHFQWIREQGILIAIDDFGSGYSTLDYINNLEVDLIKIDRSLVVDIENSNRRLDTLCSLLGLCDRLGFVVVVEGIENEAQHRLICGSGVAGLLVQGFLYAKPSMLSEKQFEAIEMSKIPTLTNNSQVSRSQLV